MMTPDPLHSHIGYIADVETFGTPPTPRYGHTALRFDDCLLIYGGRSACGNALADCHIFNFGSTYSISCAWFAMFGLISHRFHSHASVVTN